MVSLAQIRELIALHVKNNDVLNQHITYQNGKVTLIQLSIITSYGLFYILKFGSKDGKNFKDLIESSKSNNDTSRTLFSD